MARAEVAVTPPPQGARQAAAAAPIELRIDGRWRVIAPGAALWAWPARSLRELPPECPALVAECLRRALSWWHEGRAPRPCVICRRGHWAVVALGAVAMEDVDAPSGECVE